MSRNNGRERNFIKPKCKTRKSLLPATDEMAKQFCVFDEINTIIPVKKDDVSVNSEGKMVHPQR
jgi:hypothetical protein